MEDPMHEQRTALDPEKASIIARVIHTAITGGLVAIFGALIYMRSEVALEFAAEGVRVLRVTGYGLLAASVIGAQMLRGRIAPPGRGAQLGEWWTANLPKAVVVWAVAESGGLAALVLGWASADTTLMALGAAVGLALLFVNRPSRLQSTY
ncbi:MAG: hypothetical protein AMS25_00885 [Gemmatimonas sp. SM23_52]|nr:MAG: hypothetical protein AMS25_00885 [Gemmatimonas sp. SM23_52]